MNANPYAILSVTETEGNFTVEGVYWHDGEGKTGKLYGEKSLPVEIRPTMVDRFYKFDIRKGKLKAMMGTKLFGPFVDAVSLLPNLGKKVVFSKKK